MGVRRLSCRVPTLLRLNRNGIGLRHECSVILREDRTVGGSSAQPILWPGVLTDRCRGVTVDPMTRDPLRRRRAARRAPDTDPAAAEVTAVTAGVKATVWPRTGTEGGEPTPLACGMFVDEADAHEFLPSRCSPFPPARSTRSGFDSQAQQGRCRTGNWSVPRRRCSTPSTPTPRALTADDGAPESLPDNETSTPQGEASAQLPLAARTVPVALHLRTVDQQLADYGIREMWMRERTEIRHLMSPPAPMNIERNTIGRELNAIDELYDADTDHYLRTWTAAATEQARRMGPTDRFRFSCRLCRPSASTTRTSNRSTITPSPSHRSPGAATSRRPSPTAYPTALSTSTRSSPPNVPPAAATGTACGHASRTQVPGTLPSTSSQPRGRRLPSTAGPRRRRSQRDGTVARIRTAALRRAA